MGIGALNYQGVKGGLKLNDVIEEFKYAYKGQQIKAGDFVKYIEGVAGQTTETSEDTPLNTSEKMGNAISAVELDENRVFIAHSAGSGYYLYGIVVTIDGATITAGVDTALSTYEYSGMSISTVLLENGNVFVAHSYGSSYYLYGMVVSVDVTTITRGTDITISNSSAYTGRGVISSVLLPNGNVFIAHSYSSDYHLYGIVVTINGMEIIIGTDTAVYATQYAGNGASACLLPSGNIFIAHSYGANYYLHSSLVTVNGTTVSTNTNKSISGQARSGAIVSVKLLPNGNVFIAYSYNSSYYLGGVVCTIPNNTTITYGTLTQLSTTTYTASRLSTVLLSSSKVLIAHSYDNNNYYLYGMICSISGMTITAGTDTMLNANAYTGYVISPLLLDNGTIFIAHSYGSNRHLYAQIWGIDEANNIPTNEIVITEYEQQVTLATEPPFDGIALSSGVGGDDTGHNQQVKIAKPIKLLSSLPVGSLVKDISSTFLGEPVVWKIADINHEGYPDDSVTLITDKIVALRCFDAKEPNNSTYARQTSGNNKYSVSNIRQWLNSDAEAGEWYTAQHSVDQAPNSDVVANNAYADDKGFLNGFSEKFKNALLSTSLKVGLNQLDGGGSETITDKIFLASATELGVQAALASVVEGVKLSLFNDSTNILTTVTAKCVEDSEYKYESIAVGLDWIWWLRTGTTSTDECSKTCVINNNVISASVASASGYEIGVRPLCNISSSIKVSNEPDEDGCYTLLY